MSNVPVWMDSPHIMRWCKRLMEHGLAETGEQAEVIYRASPWNPLPEGKLPSDAQVIDWARAHVQAEVAE
jgi:hypothetical protein